MFDPVARFMTAERGAVSVEWVAVTAVLMVASIGLAYSLFSGGLTPIQEKTNSDFNRVNTGAPSPGG